MYREKIFHTLFSITFWIMSWMFTVIVFAAVLFYINIPISVFHCLMAMIAASLLLWIYREKNFSAGWYVVIILASVVIVAILVFFSIHLYMNAWDSNAYHKQAIGLLKNGWNPIYQSSLDFERSTGTIRLYSEDPLTWAEVYPKAAWYFGAALYKVTGNIESGKAYTLISMFILLGVSIDYLSNRTRSGWKSIVASVLIACNPIAMAQFRCFYLDGFACNILMILMIALFAIEDDRYLGDKRKIRAIIIMAVIIGCNLKTSILMFNVIICAIYIIYKFFKVMFIEGKKAELWKRTGKAFVTLLVAGVAGVLIVGTAPYITNVLRYGNLFYKTDGLLDGQLAGKTHSSIESFMLSLFGKMGNASTGDCDVKIPFAVYKDELAYYEIADTRMNGMGVWFSGILCFSLLVILVISIRKRTEYKTYFPLYMCAGIFISAMLTPLTFQQRYIGFLYIITFTAVSLLVDDSEEKGKRERSAVVIILFLICFLNIIPWGKETVKSVRNASVFKAELVKMQGASREGTIYDVCLINQEFVGLLYNLQDYDINYNYMQELLEQQDTAGVLDGWVKYKVQE